jgi:pyrroloquinoline quinone biosynthesis protein B
LSQNPCQNRSCDGGLRRRLESAVVIGLLWSLGAVLATALVSPPAPVVEGPRIRVVGTVQDGGLPHAACSCERCEAARRDPTRRRRVAALAVVLPASGRVLLVDATPDVREQLDLVRELRRAPPGRVDRAPVDGVLLTHAHMGHYLGLAFFGFEAVHSRDLQVHATPRMAGFLRANAPWDQLVRLGNVTLVEHPPGAEFPLGDGVTAGVVPVPHRDEYSDTVGYLFSGPRARVLYVPDTDGWERWQPPLVERLQGVEVAILDGTFYSPAELPGRDVAAIGHPLVTRTIDLLQPLVDAGRLRVYFTHLNHSNPALDPGSPERREIERRGFAVLQEGLEIAL